MEHVVMAMPRLTIEVDNLDLFSKMACSLYREHDIEYLSGDEEFERGRRWIFRGQSDRNWSISSTLERIHFNGYATNVGLKKLEQILVEEFLREASCHISFNGWSLFDILSFMRHYGAPTRLVDFSESPFVALHFAVETIKKQDFCVWAVCIDALNLYSSVDVA